MLNVERFQRLNLNQWWWFWCAFWRLWPINLRIKFKQGAWLRSKICWVSSSSRETKDITITSKRYNDAVLMHESVRLAARLHILPTNCLPKSIVLADMLRRRSYAAKVFIGVSKKSKQLLSHAWVEIDGTMLLEPEHVALDFTIIED